MKSNLTRKYLALITCLISLSATCVFASENTQLLDLNKDGTPDQITLEHQSYTTYLSITDGATNQKIGRVEVYRDRNDTPRINVSHVQDHTFISYFAWDGQPWSSLYELKDNKLIALTRLTQTSAQVSYEKTNQAKLIFPLLPGWEQSFKLSPTHYNILRKEGINSWYPSTVARIEKDKLIVQTELHFPSLTDMSLIEINEEYTLQQGQWVLQKAFCTSYDKALFTPITFTPPTASMQLVINGQSITAPNTSPIKQGATTMIPIRIVSEHLDTKTSWKSPTLTLTKGDQTLKLTVGSKTAYVNGAPQTLDAAPLTKNGVTFVPARFVSEHLDAKVGWDAATQTVSITSTNASAPSSSQTDTPYAMIGKGYLDSVGFSIGTPMSTITEQLGKGVTDSFQGIITHQYDNYTLNESFEKPILVGAFFRKGASIYDVTIGQDTASDVIKKIGSQYTKSTPGEGDELSPAATAYTYTYTNNNNFLLLDFDKNDRCIFATFLSR